jgi:phosphoribosylamine--glycine ligase
VLLIGSGGREHALAWRLASSSRVTQLFVMPGNAGTAQLADNVDVNPMNFAAVETFIRRNGVQFVVIGPEDPLAAGLADHVRAMGLPVFGPSRAAAQLEADKWFAKEIMRHQAIPTAEARSFTDPAAAEEYVRVRDAACVVKAAGLAKGKGVCVCYRASDAIEAVHQIMRNRVHGAAGDRIVIEELLKGPEVSILALVDGRAIYVLETSQDHKAVEDGDTGPMTGGMGAYSPTPVVSEAMIGQIEKEILVPTIDGLRREGIDYNGVLYAGLMITPSGPKVLEFNCRFGDPETQPLMMRLRSDLCETLLAAAEGKLANATLQWDPRPSLCVIATSGGYPGPCKTGFPISGLDKADALPDTKVFHGGTKLCDGKPVTDGGRVLAVTCLGRDIAEAQKRAYQALGLIEFEGMYYRKDIGYQAIRLGKQANPGKALDRIEVP